MGPGRALVFDGPWGNPIINRFGVKAMGPPIAETIDITGLQGLN